MCNNFGEGVFKPWVTQNQHKFKREVASNSRQLISLPFQYCELPLENLNPKPGLPGLEYYDEYKLSLKSNVKYSFKTDSYSHASKYLFSTEISGIQMVLGGKTILFVSL